MSDSSEDGTLDTSAQVAIRVALRRHLQRELVEDNTIEDLRWELWLRYRARGYVGPLPRFW